MVLTATPGIAAIAGFPSPHIFGQFGLPLTCD
jgi:hypothetical protein